jgi:DegV family protein with EDD domain
MFRNNLLKRGDYMNHAICQIVDSAGSLPQKFIKQNNIIEVPFYFKFQATDYFRENVDYQVDAFYQHMQAEPENVPKTAAPNINDWVEVFEQQYDQNYRKFIVTTISSKLSSSYQNAIQAKNIFLETHQETQIEIIDTLTCACGQSALEIYIHQLINKGQALESIVKTISNKISKINSIFTVLRLKYMKEGGRIGGATEFLGKLINIKPVSEFVDGEVKPIKAVLGRTRSLKQLVDLTTKRISDFSNTIIVIEHANCEEEANYLLKYLQSKTDQQLNIYKSTLGITVGGHSGPGSIGIGFIEI